MITSTNITIITTLQTYQSTLLCDCAQQRCNDDDANN